MNYAPTNATRFVLPLIVVAACVLVGYNVARSSFAAAPAATGISIGTDKSLYTVGEDVTVTLSNMTLSDVYVKNNCPYEPLSVYRLENTKWVSLSVSDSASKCAGEPSSYAIPANKSVKTGYHNWPDLFTAPGTYRIVANIESYSQGPSAEFQVVN